MEITPDRLRLSAELISYLRVEIDRKPTRIAQRLLGRAERWNYQGACNPDGRMEDKYRLEAAIKAYFEIVP